MSTLHEWLKAMRGALEVLKRECSKYDSEKLSKEEYSEIVRIRNLCNEIIEIEMEKSGYED